MYLHTKHTLHQSHSMITKRYQLTTAHSAPTCAPFNIPLHELKIARYNATQAALEAASHPHQSSARLASLGMFLVE